MQITSKNSKPAISCIFVNYHSASFLRASLESLSASEEGIDYEIILVNNDKEEAKEIQSLQKQFQTKRIDAFHNPGFAAGANLGAALAAAPLLFFINPDTLWRKPFFKEIISDFEQNTTLGILGIALDSPEEWKKTINTKLLRFPGISFFDSKPEKDEWVSGGALFIRKEIFERLNGFDERFFLYFEDMDLCKRAGENNYQVFLDTQHTLTHFSGQSHKGRKSQKKFYDQSLYRYIEKHWSKAQSTLFKNFHPLYRFFFPYGRQ